MTATIKVTARMRKELDLLLSEKGSERFRRSDLSCRIYPLTVPRNRERADAISDAVMKEAFTYGVIERTGHQHWKRTGEGRKLIGGRVARETVESVDITLKTHCPSKWLGVDLETGHVWIGSEKGWKKAPNSSTIELQAVVNLLDGN